MTTLEMFEPRTQLVKRLEKALESVTPERHLFIVTSWMSEDDFRNMVEFLEEQNL